MYLSSDSSSILVSCHRSPLSIIHYYPLLSIIHYPLLQHCNIALQHSIIQYPLLRKFKSSKTKIFQPFCLWMFLSFFVGSPPAFINLPFLGIHLPKKHLFLVFSSHHIWAFLMVNQCLVGVWIYQLISWTFWVVNLFVFHHWIILFSPTITNIYTFPSKQKQTLRNYSIGWISNPATSTSLSCLNRNLKNTFPHTAIWTFSIY